MIVIALNIPPKEKSANTLQNSSISDEEREERILKIIEYYDADVIFFVETYGLIFEPLQKKMESIGYRFYFPDGYKPSKLSFCGVVAAVKDAAIKEVDAVEFGDGSDIGMQCMQARFLYLKINNDIYAGVHYPLPINDHESFANHVNNFMKDEKPKLLLGDFNPASGYSYSFNDYQDILPKNCNTTLFETKLDYVFTRLDESYQAIFDDSVIDPDHHFFSDHVLIGVII